MGDSEAKSSPARRAIRLGPLPRWVFGILGTAGLGGGSVAVFTQDVEAGPVAMLGIGAFFFIIGIVGVMPTRLKIGDNEAEFLEEVGEQLAAVSELVPPESRQELYLALERLSRVAPEAASPAMAGLAYEELVSGLLSLALDSINAGNKDGEALQMERQQGRQQSRFDAVLRRGNRLAAGIEIKAYTKPIGPTMIRELADQVAAWQPGTELKRALLVTRSPLRSAAQQELKQSDGILEYVAVAGVEDLAHLTQALRRILKTS